MNLTKQWKHGDIRGGGREGGKICKHMLISKNKN